MKTHVGTRHLCSLSWRVPDDPLPSPSSLFKIPAPEVVERERLVRTMRFLVENGTFPVTLTEQHVETSLRAVRSTVRPWLGIEDIRTNPARWVRSRIGEAEVCFELRIEVAAEALPLLGIDVEHHEEVVAQHRIAMCATKDVDLVTVNAHPCVRHQLASPDPAAFNPCLPVLKSGNERRSELAPCLSREVKVVDGWLAGDEVCAFLLAMDDELETCEAPDRGSGI